MRIYDDDIVEEDNRLPAWWRATLWGSVIFAGIYWYGEHRVNAWPSRADAYQEETVQARLASLKNGAPLPPEALLALSRTPATVEQGKALFATTCAPCHRADGGGNIGPNLTDDFWLHGGKPENIWSCVHDGVPAKGMPTWGPQLGDAKVAALVAYVLTIRNTNVPGGKPPQGEKEL